MKALRTDLQLEEEILFGLRPSPVGSSSVAQTGQPRAADPGLAGLRQQARREPDRQFRALLHYVDVDLLKAAYQWLKDEGARAAGGRTWTTYGVNLDHNAVALYTRLQRGQHRTLPPWRRALALAQGQRRPLKRAALKDRIVQRAVAAVLDSIFEADFLGPGCGFEPVCSQAEIFASRDLADKQEKLCWLVKADIARLGKCIRAKMLLKCLKGRIGDQRMLDLIERWLNAGLLDEADDLDGSGAAPANPLAVLMIKIFLHHSFDAWAQRWRHRHARSTMILARDATHLMAVFEHKPGARRFQADLRTRIRQCAPALRPLDVHLVGFSRRTSGSLDEGDLPTLLMRTADR